MTRDARIPHRESGDEMSATMRRGDKLISDRAEIDRILNEAKVARLGLVDGDRPYVVPLNFAHQGDVLWFHCADTGHKLDCLRANAAVCIEADRFIALKVGASACGAWTSHYESVVGFGTGEIVADEDEKRAGLTAIMRKYSGREDWEFTPATFAKTVVVRVRLESLTGKRSPAPQA